MPPRKINVLVVEDSHTSREMLVRLLQSDPGIRVERAVADGAAALAAIEDLKPDVVTMDIHMPGMDGFEATRRIMETFPVPIIIVSASYDAVDVEKTFRALEAGAVAVVEKPTGFNGNGNTSAQKLLGTVKAMAEVRVVRRWPRARQSVRQAATARIELPPRVTTTPQVVAIGASTGGPPVLRTILEGLGPLFGLPVLIVQHISAGFVQGLADWLTGSTGMPVHIAKDAEQIRPGHVYLAPDGCQMSVDRIGVLTCRPAEPENGLQPAVSVLFRSVAKSYGAGAIGVLLTGMGRDGAAELKLMRDAGAVTIAQDKESSVVHGMPGEAISLDAAGHVLSPERIVSHINLISCKPSFNGYRND